MLKPTLHSFRVKPSSGSYASPRNGRLASA
jgi:hypothetical protein